MRKLSIFGISVLGVGIFFLILTGFDYTEHLKTKAYLETVCNNPGTNCPLEDPWSLLPQGITSLSAIIIGSLILSLSTNKHDSQR